MSYSSRSGWQSQPYKADRVAASALAATRSSAYNAAGKPSVISYQREGDLKLLIYSKGLYSSWIFYSPDRLLFDCGEGASSHLGNKSFAIQRVFLSHGHTDHVAGLLSLINIRNSAMGDTTKSLTVYHPVGNRQIALLKTYLAQAQPRLRYELQWTALEPGERVPVFSGPMARSVVAFRTQHGQDPSLGYNIVEERKRLKPEFQGKPQDELRTLAKSGKADLSEVYEQKLFSYGGDSVPLDPAHVEGTEVLCHDTTFLVEEDRQEYKHATLKEAVQVAHAAGVKRELLAFHISSRYKLQLAQIADEIKSWKLPFTVTLIPPGKIYRQL